MEWVVIVMACVGVAALVVWFVTARKHPEAASTHLDRAHPEQPTHQADDVARRPAGPDAESMSPDP